MGRPRADSVRTATPERILESAEAVFAAVGFGAATLAEIAERAGIRRPSLLYHFPTKEALYAATVERMFGRLRAALLHEMQQGGDFASRVAATLERYVDFLDAEPEVARILLWELLAGQGPGAAILLQQLVPLLSMVEAWIRREGEGIVRRDLPVRAAVTQIASDILLRSASGPLREALWGSSDHARMLAQFLLLEESRS